MLVTRYKLTLITLNRICLLLVVNSLFTLYSQENHSLLIAKFALFFISGSLVACYSLQNLSLLVTKLALTYCKFSRCFLLVARSLVICSKARLLLEANSLVDCYWFQNHSLLAVKLARYLLPIHSLLITRQKLV